MKTLILSIAFIFAFQITKAQYNDSRFEITLTTTLNGKKIPLKLDNISYTLNDDALYPNEPIDIAAPKRQKNINVTAHEGVTASLLAIFEKKKQLVNGVIEIKDNYSKVPTRTIVFEKAFYYLTESISSNDNSNYISITIACDNITIDGVQVDK